MRRLSVSLLALPFLLAACPGGPGLFPDPDPYPDSDPGPDGVPCAQSAGAERVWIDIPSYQEGPKDDCEVDQGTTIVWRGPPEEEDPFALEFTGPSPGGPGSQREYTSRDRGDRHTVTIDASGPPGPYPYAIKVDGVVLDPAIIIR